MKKVLQLSTYPIAKPLHGGQIRVSEIRKYFERNECLVKTISLSEMSHGFFDTEDDYLLEENELRALVNTPLCTDLATSLITSHGKAFSFLEKKIMDFNPDIILLEQPWLWPSVKRLLKERKLNKNVKIIYSSQNIEYVTKRTLLEQHNIPLGDIDKVVNDIYKLEKEICSEADWTITCTEVDANKFKTLGAKKTLVCNNGVAKRNIDPLVSELLISDLKNRKYALFVGSAYPPNALGFWEMMGESLAWLPPECIVIAAGGVSKILENYMPESAKMYSYVSMDRIKKMGFVSEELLASLVDNASVILLPITIGGGSNLKTAEAIASGRPVVATSVACRGFDFVNKLSNFKIADSKEEFIKYVNDFLSKEEINITNIKEKTLRESVYWRNSLHNLKVLIE